MAEFNARHLDAALAYARQAVALDPELWVAHYHLAADRAPRYVPPYARALVYAGLGDQESTLSWLEKAFEQRDVHLVFLPVDPKWDPYRKDQRFERLLTRCGFGRTAAAPVGTSATGRRDSAAR